MSRKPKVLIFDLETADFNANVGFLMAFGYMWLGDKTAKCLRIDDYDGYEKDLTNDRRIVTEAHKIICQADALVSWYGRNFCFDEPYFRTRCAKYKLPAIPYNLPHWDGQQVCRKYFKFRNNRLDTVGKFIGTDLKTHFDGELWFDAITGQRKQMNKIVDHCKRDVIQLRDIYLRLRSYAPHPNVALMAEQIGTVCPTCSSPRLKSWGWRHTLVGRYRRWRCLDCKSFSQGRKHEGPKVELRA